MSNKEKVVFLSSISSDIGIALAQRYSRDGYIVTGTYRSAKFLNKLRCLPDCHLFYCDLNEARSIEQSIAEFEKLNLQWETFISLAVQPQPLSNFFITPFNDWSSSVHVNAIEQLRVLHRIHRFRRKDVVSNVVFFAGPGTNNVTKDFSALILSKIMLIKMCEILNIENEDLNAFIIGPGWTKTKTHEVIMAAPEVSKERYTQTKNFMLNEEGTNMEDIYQCIRWLSVKGRAVAGGRNFSIVHDIWGKEDLARALESDFDMYKLRRYKNEFCDKNPSSN